MFIPDEFFRCEEYREFDNTREGSLYKFLRANIVRESYIFNTPYYHPAYGIYKNYYKNGLLVARYPQRLLADYLGTHEFRIRERLNSLEEKGFIKRIKIRYKKSFICFYELGTWSGKIKDKKSYKEHFYLDEYFSKVAKSEKEQHTTENQEKVQP